jgi:site-specific DNA-cytosine methylase
MKRLNVLGVMGGNGVCLYPFHKSKYFNVLGNWELRPVFYDRHNNQWSSNFQDTPQHREFRQYQNVDVIIGHPDCGDSSILRMSRSKKKGEVSENKSVSAYIRAIDEFKPNFFLLENLPGFLDTYPLEYWNETFPEYAIKYWIEPVSSWGNSQVTRKRLVIIGWKLGISTKMFQLPKGIELKYSQYFELGPEQLPEICHVRESMDKTANLIWGDDKIIPYRTAEYVWNTSLAGKSRWHVGGKMKNQPGVTRNLPDKFPSTVRKQNRQFTTDGLVLSPREMANIQGVPQDFNLIFHPENDVYWINKARLTVTKTMPYEVANWFRRKLVRIIKTRL